jgi:hypothetical protein
MTGFRRGRGSALVSACATTTTDRVLRPSGTRTRAPGHGSGCSAAGQVVEGAPHRRFEDDLENRARVLN